MRHHSGRIAGTGFLLVVLSCAGSHPVSAQQDNDHTLEAMRDEMARSKARLELQIPTSQQTVRPFYIEYRLLDLEVREVVGEFDEVPLGVLQREVHLRTGGS